MPRNQIRDKRVVTFLTRDEYRTLEKIADDSGLSISRACHDLIVGGVGPIRPLESAAESPEWKKK